MLRSALLVALCALLLLACGLERARSQSSLPTSSPSGTPIPISRDTLQNWKASLDKAADLLTASEAKTQDLQRALDEAKKLEETLKEELTTAEASSGKSQETLTTLSELFNQSQAISDALSARILEQEKAIGKAGLDAKALVLQRDVWKYVGIGALVAVAAETLYLLVKR